MNATQDERHPFSTKLTSGAGTYYLDIRKTRYDNTYLQITERRPRSEGDGFEQNRIFVFSENYEDFFKSLGQVHHFLKSHPEAMRPDKKRLPRRQRTMNRVPRAAAVRPQPRRRRCHCLATSRCSHSPAPSDSGSRR